MKLALIGLALASILAVAAAFNPLGALQLLRQVGGFVIDKLRAGVAWAREPGRNWWKIACLSFGFLFASAAWYADMQRLEVIRVTDKCKTDAKAMRAEFKTATEAADTTHQSLLQCRQTLVDEVGLAQQVIEDNKKAVKDAQAVAERAQRDLAEWNRRQRPADCTAALADLEAKCATFADY